MEIKDLLKELTDVPGISGYEAPAAEVAASLMKPFSDEVDIDKQGSVIALKHGWQSGDKRDNILLAAHLDEIGLMVTKIEDGGFMRITNVGGVDVCILPGQAVKVFGKETVRGVIGAKPPHLQQPGDSGKPIQMDDLFIDTGKGKEELEKIIEIGAIVRIESEFINIRAAV